MQDITKQLGGMDWVTIGRLAGAAVIVIGAILSLWEVIDRDFGDGSEQVLFFLQDILYWGAFGMVILMVTEIADRVGGGPRGGPGA